LINKTIHYSINLLWFNRYIILRFILLNIINLFFLSIEASILSALHHPSIITHIESFEEDGNLCLVTEYAEKGDLSNKLEERKGTLLPEEQILDWFVQMALAMLYLHKKKVNIIIGYHSYVIMKKNSIVII